MKKIITIFLLLSSVITLIGCNNNCEHLKDTSLIVVDEKIEPTCESNGLSEGSHCSLCGEIIEYQEIIPSLGHTYKKIEKEEPTCSSVGHTEGQECSVCGKILVSPTVIEKDINNHVNRKLIEIPINGIEGMKNVGIFQCSSCGLTYYDQIKYDDINIPILHLDGDFLNISKENKIQISAYYEDEKQKFEADATLKWQGASSLQYEKKNYNIQFFKKGTDFDKKYKVEMKEGWGEESKYTLKANYIDYSQSRNVVSARIYGDIVRSRNKNDVMNTLVNGGAIDGFPIIMFQNGVFYGLYTFNIAKDDYMVGMGDNENLYEAMLMADDWTTSVSLKEHLKYDFSNGFELEYCSTEDNEEIGTSWVVESFNKMIDFVNNNDSLDFIRGINDYVDVDRAIDSMLYTSFIHANDNVAKNILWLTYDGVTWIPSMYDMDGTWGLYWDGSIIDYSELWLGVYWNQLWKKIFDNMSNRIKNRWIELREGPLSYDNIVNKFSEFIDAIPSIVKEAEKQKWNQVPSQDQNNLDQIKDFTKVTLNNFDNYFGFNTK